MCSSGLNKILYPEPFYLFITLLPSQFSMRCQLSIGEIIPLLGLSKANPFVAKFSYGFY